MLKQNTFIAVITWIKATLNVKQYPLGFLFPVKLIRQNMHSKNAK